MEKNKKILVIVLLIFIIAAVVVSLLYTGTIHNGSFAMPGTTYGPGTYEIGTDLPAGKYDIEGKFDLNGNAVFQASQTGGLHIYTDNVQLKSGSIITIYDGGNLTYIGS